MMHAILVCSFVPRRTARWRGRLAERLQSSDGAFGVPVAQFLGSLYDVEGREHMARFFHAVAALFNALFRMACPTQERPDGRNWALLSRSLQALHVFAKLFDFDLAQMNVQRLFPSFLHGRSRRQGSPSTRAMLSSRFAVSRVVCCVMCACRLPRGPGLCRKFRDIRLASSRWGLVVETDSMIPFDMQTAGADDDVANWSRLAPRVA